MVICYCLLQPDGNIYPLIMYILNDQTRDLSAILSTKNNDDRKAAVKESSDNMVNLVTYISSIMVKYLKPSIRIITWKSYDSRQHMIDITSKAISTYFFSIETYVFVAMCDRYLLRLFLRNVTHLCIHTDNNHPILASFYAPRVLSGLLMFSLASRWRCRNSS